MILTHLRPQEEFYLNVTEREGWWEEDIASQRGEERRNIWKISVLSSLPETDLTTERVTGCTLRKVSAHCVVPLLHPGVGAAKMCPLPSNLRFVEETKKCSLTSQKWPFLSSPGKGHSRSPLPPSVLPSSTAAQMSPRNPAGSHQLIYNWRKMQHLFKVVIMKSQATGIPGPVRHRQNSLSTPSFSKCPHKNDLSNALLQV